MSPSLLQLGRRMVRSITVGRHGAAEARQRKGLILLYHRVASPECDPQQLCVSPENFAAQLPVLKQVARPLPLAEMASRVIAKDGNGHGNLLGNADAPAVAVTFDDGYADNFLTARPILAAQEIPATVFVAAGYVDAQREFWWDELEGLLLHPGELPRRLSISAVDGPLSCDLNGSPRYSQADFARHRGWSVTEPDDPTPRHALYRLLCERLRRMPVATREQALVDVLRWAGRQRRVRESHRAVSADELREWARNDSIEIGAHTMHHPILSGLSADAQECEIVHSRRRLHEITGTAPTSFSYPYGTRRDYGGRTVQLVRSAGFSRACVNSPGFVGRRTDPFRLPRFVVRDWPADVFARRIEEWLRG